MGIGSMSSSLTIATPRLAVPASPARSAGGTDATTFRDYVLTRKYDFGRGSASTWAFIAFARGDVSFPQVQSWRELNAYLVHRRVEPDLVEAARTSWRSFKSLQSRSRRKWVW